MPQVHLGDTEIKEGQEEEALGEEEIHQGPREETRLGLREDTHLGPRGGTRRGPQGETHLGPLQDHPGHITQGEREAPDRQGVDHPMVRRP